MKFIDSSTFHKILLKQGMKFRLGTKYTGAEKKQDGSGYILSLESNKDRSKDKVHSLLSKINYLHIRLKLMLYLLR